MTMLARILLLAAGLFGAGGVAAAAAASHAGESRNLAALAAIFLAHGPALLALALHGKSRPILMAGAVLAVGTAIFGADLLTRELSGAGLVLGAAPLGGGLMLLGWLGISVTALARHRPD